VKFKPLNSQREVNINIAKYLIDWEPKKEVSKPQGLVKKFLRPFWKNDVVLEELKLPKSLMRCDLANISKKIILEISPESTHLKFNKFMHGSLAGYLAVIKRDEEKRLWAEHNEFTFIELNDDEINNLSKAMFKEKYDLDL
jgi:hypothetical protein